DWKALPPELPVSIRTLLEGCVAKDRRQRIGNLSAALFVIDHHGTLGQAVEVPISANRARGWRTAVIASAVVIVALATGYTAWTLKPTAPRAVTRSTILLPVGDRFSNPGSQMVAFSPDGTRLVYNANGRLYLHMMDQLESIPIRGTEGQGINAGRQPF